MHAQPSSATYVIHGKRVLDEADRAGHKSRVCTAGNSHSNESVSECTCSTAARLRPAPGDGLQRLEDGACRVQRAGSYYSNYSASEYSGRTAGRPQGDDEVSGHSCSNAVCLHPVRGSGVPEEALVGVHVQVAAVAGHLVEGVRIVARLPPQALHTV